VFGVLGWLKGLCLISDIRLFSSGLLIASSRAFLYWPLQFYVATLPPNSKRSLTVHFGSLALIRGSVYSVVLGPQTSTQQQSTVATKLEIFPH
jgi:hypothetical protein